MKLKRTNMNYQTDNKEEVNSLTVASSTETYETVNEETDPLQADEDEIEDAEVVEDDDDFASDDDLSLEGDEDLIDDGSEENEPLDEELESSGQDTDEGTGNPAI